MIKKLLFVKSQIKAAKNKKMRIIVNRAVLQDDRTALIFLKSKRRIAMNQSFDFFDGLSDEELLFIIKYGNKEPFEILLRRYNPLVGKAIQGFYVRGYDKDDFHQEARIVFFHAVNSYDNTKGYTFGKFFQLTLKNHIYSLVRRDMAQKRQSEKTATSLEALTEKGMAPSGESTSYHLSTPLDYVVINDKLTDYHELLSPLEKRVFSAYLKRESVNEIAERMEISVNKIKNALDRCKRKMKDRLTEENT